MNGRAGLQVTPLILTLNEEPNLSRTLDSLRWASRVVVLDSGSTDATESIAKSFPNVHWCVRPFDSHGVQWDYGIRQTGIATDYILGLDADMMVPEAFVAEMETHFLPGNFSGGITPFEYRVVGRPLFASILRPQLRLFRGDEVRVRQGGHTQELSVAGPIYHFRVRIIHDDRKSVERWVQAQLRYSLLEKERIERAMRLSWKDRLRRAGVMPLIAGGLAYLRAGGPFMGTRAARYALERAAYECLVSLRLFTSEPPKEEDRGNDQRSTHPG